MPHKRYTNNDLSISTTCSLLQVSRVAQTAIREQGFGSAAENVQRASDLERSAHAIALVRSALASMSPSTAVDANSDSALPPNSDSSNSANSVVEQAAKALHERTGELERQLLAALRGWLEESMEELLGEGADAPSGGDDRALQVSDVS